MAKKKTVSKGKVVEDFANEVDQLQCSWPTRLQLTCWSVFERLQDAPHIDLTPEIIHDWIEEAMGKESLALHAHFYKEYEDFRQLFVPPQESKDKDTLSTVTKRELEALRHITAGQTNVEIAKSMGISKETVKEFVSKLLKKTGLRDRTQLAVWALRQGVDYL